ncbi:hypothetical protein [Glutamicibacter protophormiae]|uniref:Uncharacterized protein n=1 Tax=Glutamicibacter protophormiae TaxID=37930 RepID=A0ABS4XQD3_GLUPR|nr:hypothetical protein [Glutamicibacter protophormiae]MBP2398725.1 hypothetical protein [Glutamicibacter protophormiae]GGL81983.1 hypothetical protein GCM10010038_09940 [Glutamicibacter protophormiae]
MFIWYQSSVPNHRGIYPGIFGLANTLANNGKLSDTDWATWRSGNDWYNAAYPDPCKTNPAVYDSQVNPHAAAWFKDTATHLLERIEPYLELLKRHDVQVVKLISADPGQIIYEDTVQIVVVPHEVKI